ncbi:MAG TPA: D-sedoheptulose 7-phosphate isomerase [Williamwhitmania sp.]|nr:D-sedoheptulose 7-phosphate isomerase [Williamwhitmania sp.]
MIDPILQVRQNFQEARDVLELFMSESQSWESIEKAGILMVEAIEDGHKLISCGNGGSMSDAMHFAEELSGRFRGDRRALPAIAISDPSHITCSANDFGYDKVFARFVEAIGSKGDVLVAISTSGNSANVMEACIAARQKGMKIVGLTGKNGGKLAGMCDVEIRVPFFGFADRVQEVHIKIIHSLIHYIEMKLGLTQ